MTTVAEIIKIAITDTAKLDKESKSLATSITNNDKRISVYLFSEIMHIEKHRNPTRLNVFLSKVRGSGARVNAMFKFISLFANVKLNEDAGKPGQKGANFRRHDDKGQEYFWYFDMRPERKKELYDAKLQAAAAKEWFKHVPEAPPATIVFEDKLAQFLKQQWGYAINGAGEKNEVKTNPAFLAELTELALKHGVKIEIPEAKKGHEIPKELKETAVHANQNAPEAKTETTSETKTETQTQEGGRKKAAKASEKAA